MENEASRYELDDKALIELARAYKVKQLHLFGSAFTEDFTDESDIDIMVVFETGMFILILICLTLK